MEVGRALTVRDLIMEESEGQEDMLGQFFLEDYLAVFLFGIYLDAVSEHAISGRTYVGYPYFISSCTEPPDPVRSFRVSCRYLVCFRVYFDVDHHNSAWAL